MTRFADILLMLVKRDIKARYSGSLMGIFWSFGNPLLYIAIFTLVFSVILKVRFGLEGGTAEFVFYLLAGILPWFMIQEAVLRSTSSFTDNRELVKSINFPGITLPLSCIFSSLVNQLAGMAVFIAILALKGSTPCPDPADALLFLFLVVIQILLALGLGLSAAVINNYFRDVTHLMGAFLLFWMYCTPIFYPVSLVAAKSGVPGTVSTLIHLNPLTHIIAGFRRVFLGTTDPLFAGLLYAAAFTALISTFGFSIFFLYRRRFPELL